MPVFIVFVFIIYLSVSRDCVGGFLDRQTTIIQRVVFRAFKVDARCRGKLQKMHKLHGVGDLHKYVGKENNHGTFEKKSDKLAFLNERNLEK